MRELNPLENICFRVGGVLMVVGAALFIVTPMVSMCIYGIGTLMFTLMQLRTEYLGRDITIMRLRRQQLLACCCFIIALVLMSMELYQWGPCHSREWVIALTIGCILELYTSIRIPQELGKN